MGGGGNAVGLRPKWTKGKVMIASLCWNAAQRCAKSNCFLICHNASGQSLKCVSSRLGASQTAERIKRRIWQRSSTWACTWLPSLWFDLYQSNVPVLQTPTTHPASERASRPASQWVVVQGHCWHKIRWNTPTGLQRADIWVGVGVGVLASRSIWAASCLGATTRRLIAVAHT